MKNIPKFILAGIVAAFLFACGNTQNIALPKDAIVAAEVNIPQPTEAIAGFEVTDRVEIKTTVGNLVIGLYGNDAPETVLNFLNYVNSGFYKDKIFHRVIPGFMIQGGGFDVDMKKHETQNPIELELIPGLKHTQGIVSMARTSDSTKTATSQFFICISTTPQLNGLYAPFGKVEEGIDVMLNISSVITGSSETEYGVLNDVPVKPVIIHSITKF